MRLATTLLLLPLAVACVEQGRNAPVRSPRHDYGREPVRTSSDGTVVGADGKDPEQKVEEVTSSGWYVDEAGVPRYDPARRVGGNVDKKFETERPEQDQPKRE
ncbi:MAG: hypothetical protein DIU78_001390 [Pseudomonadota bacterium]|nr:MAG: hypothetical protein DIU78_02345 [Pseudomonadota bacterium]